MLLSLKAVKRIESIKIELRLALKKLSDGIHGMYEGLLINQHGKRIERIEFARIKRTQLRDEAVALIAKINAELIAESVKMQDKEDILWAERCELHAALTNIKKDGDPNA